MSGSFLDRYGATDPFDSEDDGTYLPWVTCQQGAVINLKIVPAQSTGEPVRHIPYLQPITIEHHRATDQLCLLCHSTGMTISIEGRGLEELSDLIAEKRIKVITVFDPAIYPQSGNEESIISSVSFESYS